MLGRSFRRKYTLYFRISNYILAISLPGAMLNDLKKPSCEYSLTTGKVLRGHSTEPFLSLTQAGVGTECTYWINRAIYEWYVFKQVSPCPCYISIYLLFIPLPLCVQLIN